jgi:GNAT superfamily N-acetyltransferase
MSTWTIQRLQRTHDRSAFDCGRPLLNEWLKNRAGQFDRRDLSRTFVATRPGESVVRGYYAISTHRVLYEDMPDTESKGLPRIDVPVVLLGRLAVDNAAQGQGLGAWLLVDVLRRAIHISDQVGIRAVEVDAIDGTARQFYLKFGFRSLLDDPKHLLMPMHEIRKLKLDPSS